jgi:hypothetical protein
VAAMYNEHCGWQPGVGAFVHDLVGSSFAATTVTSGPLVQPRLSSLADDLSLPPLAGQT